MPIYGYRLDISFPALDKVEGGIRWIEKGLSFKGLQTNNFKALGTANTEGGLEEMDGCSFRGDI